MATTPYPFVANAVLTASQLNSTYNIPVSTKTASYVLVAADGGTRVAMNSASATTITVNTSVFSAGDSVFIYNAGAGTCTITAGTATVTTSGLLALAANAGGTLYFTSASAAIFFASGVTAASKIAQVVSATFNTETSTSSTTFVTTGLNASITPTLNTSKILIIATTFGYQATISPIALFTLFRGTVAGTNLATGATPFMSGAYSGAGDLQFAVACQFVDSPATTSATTYTLGFRATSAATVTAQKGTAQASITLMEILA